MKIILIVVMFCMFRAGYSNGRDLSHGSAAEDPESKVRCPGWGGGEDEG